MTANTLPVDSNSRPASGGFDPTTQHVVAQKMGPAQTTSGTEYAPAIVNIADPTTPANQLAVNSLGQIAISNFPAVQSIIGTVSIAQFPSVQTVSGSVDVSDRAARQLGHVIVDLGGAGTNTAPGYTIIQDGTLNTRKMVINADGSIIVQPGNTQNTISWVTKGATNNGTQAASSAGNNVIKASPGTLYSAIITTVGTAGLNVYDNASTNSGAIILAIPANAAVGTIYAFPGGMPATFGITSAGVANCPGVTFAYGPA